MYDLTEEYDGYTIKRKHFHPTDPRLGRHVLHDSRSLNYQVEAVEDLSTLKSIRHTRAIPTLDQGNLGSCTGNATTGNLGTGVFWDESVVQAVLSPADAAADEKFAVGIYSDATKIDNYRGTYPPTDTGSDGLSVAKAAQNRGLISGYQHATSFDAFVTALSKQAVIVGTEWRNDMFNPDADGRLHITGNVEGGHEYVFDELDVENQRVWMHNSWGDSWGVQGRAYFTWTDFKTLLASQGDCTVFVPVSQPAPTPTPPAPTPTPTPTPPEPDKPTVFEELVEDLKTALDKLVAWFREN